MAFELRTRGRVHRIEPGLGTHVFNGGLVDAWGKLLTVYRCNRRPSLLAVSELTEDLEPSATRILWEAWDPVLVPEDPRAVVTPDGSLYLMFVGVNSKDWSKATICHATLDSDYRFIWKSACWFEWQDACEKNWVPLYRDGQLCCIYNYDPLTILRYEAGAWRLEQARRVDWPWSYGRMSGGAPPVWHNGRWYCFFHSSKLQGDVKVYYAGVCALDADLNPIACTTQPILAGATHAGAYVWPEDLPWRPGSKVSAVFPCGALLRGDEWLVSYGLFDAELRIARIPAAAIDEALGLPADHRNGKLRRAARALSR